MKTFKEFIKEANKFRSDYGLGAAAAPKNAVADRAKIDTAMEPVVNVAKAVIPGATAVDKLAQGDYKGAAIDAGLNLAGGAVAGGAIKAVAKVGERQTAKTLGKWLAKDQEAGRLNIPRHDIHADIKTRYPETPAGDSLLSKDLSNPKTKHTLWSLGQHMEKDPQVQKRIVDTLRKNDPSDKRIQFTTDRINVNKYGNEKFGKETWDNVRDPTKKYDSATKSYVPKENNPNFIPPKSAAEARARARPGGDLHDPNLRQAVVATKAKTQPSFANRWDDVPATSVVDKVVDKVIGAKYDKYGQYIGK